MLLQNKGLVPRTRSYKIINFQKCTLLLGFCKSSHDSCIWCYCAAARMLTGGDFSELEETMVYISITYLYYQWTPLYVIVCFRDSIGGKNSRSWSWLSSRMSSFLLLWYQARLKQYVTYWLHCRCFQLRETFAGVPIIPQSLLVWGAAATSIFKLPSF